MSWNTFRQICHGCLVIPSLFWDFLGDFGDSAFTYIGYLVSEYLTFRGGVQFLTHLNNMTVVKQNRIMIIS